MRAEAIAIVSNTICVDEGRCRLMELVSPENIELCVVPSRSLVDVLSRFNAANILLLFQDMETVLEVIDMGVVLEHVNVGNLHHLKGGIEVAPSVYMNQKDLEVLERLADMGVAVEAREVPDGRSFDLVGYLAEFGRDD